MRLGLRMGLNSRQGGGSALDPDARLYIAAVEAVLPGNNIATALPNATSNPKRIISDFIKAEKAASRWSLHKRIYLPIYNNAAASAIDMVSRTSGTFTGLGSVTHAAGYVQGNGTSGYFDFNAIPSVLGLTTSSGSVFVLHKAAPVLSGDRVSVDSVDGSDTNKVIDLNFQTSAVILSYNTTTISSGAILAASSRIAQTGVFVASRHEGNRSIYRRNSSAFSILATQTAGDFGSVPIAKTFAAMRTQSGSGGAYSDAQMGVYGAGLGLSEYQSTGFSANLKTLWESLTGLTLP